MESGPGNLFDDDGQPAFTRSVVGDDVVVRYRGMLVAAFCQSDELMRDVVVAMLVLGGHGLTTDAIAVLCGVSHGWVCEVRKRFRSGGLEAVLARGTLGPPRLLVGGKAERLKEMHGAGVARSAIAAALGVSEGLIAKEVKRLSLPRSGWANAQKSVPGVGAGTRSRGRRAAIASRSAGPACATSVEREATTSHGDGLVVPPEKPALTEERERTVAKSLDEANAASVPLEGEPAVPHNGDENVKGLGETPPATDVKPAELAAGAPLTPGTEHSCRYAGTLLLCAAASAIGVPRALELASVVRPIASAYDALQVLFALMAAWIAGYRSLEAMHERDARALGVIQGLERSPSVRTLHRAIAQMSGVFDPVELGAGLIRGLLDARRPERLWFGADGHFKTYTGDSPIDKGWDSKRRLATKGLMDVMLTDEQGWTWHVESTPAGEALSKQLLQRARVLRGVLGDQRPIVLASDRGGFEFDELNAMDRDGFFYVGYVPASVSLPDLAAIVPTTGGVGEMPWTHPRLHHRARLLVERDGDTLIPVMTNLTTLVDAVEVMNGLRSRRGSQENSFKAARTFAHIDTLVDRGHTGLLPDDRLVRNPAREALDKERRHADAELAALKKERGSHERSEALLRHEIFWTELESSLLHTASREAPAKVPRVTIEPEAKRTTLKTRHRLLLQPIKFAAENARRWLLETLGLALAPTDHLYDQEALARTLTALLRAPGSVRFSEDLVTVTLDFPLPPTAHERLAAGLENLDHRSLRFTDGTRRVAFRLAPRPTRASLYDHPGDRDRAT